MSQTTLRPELQLLMDRSRSELKRWGGSELNLFHLAAAVQRRWSDVFATEFGVGATSQLERVLRAGASCGTEADVLEILEQSDGPDAISAVVERLSGAIGLLLRDAEGEQVAASTPAGDEQKVSLRADGDRQEPAEDAEGSSVAPVPEAWAVPARSARFVVRLDGSESPLAREDLVDDILGCIACRRPRVPLLIGEPGVGKTRIADAVAARLADATYTGPLRQTPVIRVIADRVVAAERATTLSRILEDCDGDVVVFIDDVDALTGIGGLNPDALMLAVLRAAVRQGRRLILAADSSLAGRIEVHDSSLWSGLTVLTVRELAQPALKTVVDVESAVLAEHHGVMIPELVAQRALSPRSGKDKRVHPGLAIDRLDRACVRATLRVDRTVREDDLGLPGDHTNGILESGRLGEQLALRVLGQQASVDLVADRLALTRAGLDLRPERPDGVFLFVGPTGVGKTELARAISTEVFGSDTALIRLDMSEYAQDWALSRLVGPQPGYVGFTEPESWLTTRVMAAPNSVILLDEIEKAHPTIWNAFLQVFDAGRLSDARGASADFSNTVIVMTSNLGSAAFKTKPLGFGAQPDSRSIDSQVVESVKAAMAPELVNRLDAVVVFHPLDRDAIRQIAKKEVAAAFDKLATRGYSVSIDEDALDLLSVTGYNPEYGARHLQRNVETLLLQPLVGQRGRKLRATCTDGSIRWVESPQTTVTPQE